MHRGLEGPCEDIGGVELLGCVTYKSLVLWITQRTDWLHFECQSDCVMFLCGGGGAEVLNGQGELTTLLSAQALTPSASTFCVVTTWWILGR